MKKIKICYSNSLNGGDAINPIIVKEVLGYEPILTDQFDCDISGIGSGLRRFFVDLNNNENIYTNDYKKNKEISNNREFIIWSAGFISTPTGHETPISSKMKIASVRGKESKYYVEKILSKKLDCTVGDGGLLVSKLIAKPVRRKYSLGIIPHRREKGEYDFNKILNEVEDSIIIDIEQPNVMKLIYEISQCEAIISSSLHGLIFADSFCIPNKHVVLTNRLAGDGFKFRDYYSTWDLEDSPIDLKNGTRININEIKKDYKLTSSDIEGKQHEIIKAFNRYI